MRREYTPPAVRAATSYVLLLRTHLLRRRGHPLEDVTIAQAQSRDVDDQVRVPLEVGRRVEDRAQHRLVVTLDLPRGEDGVGGDAGDGRVGGADRRVEAAD